MIKQRTTVITHHSDAVMASKLLNKADVTSAQSQHAKKHVLAVFQLIFWARGHAIFQGGRTKYSTLIYKSTLVYYRFPLCQVR